MSANKVLKLRLSLKGRPIRTYVFDQDCVRIGRNPDAEVYLDNAGISREHLLIERKPAGYLAQDLNSANGTFINDKQIQKQYLYHEDVVRIGKFSLWVSLEEDRRSGPGRHAAAAGTMGGTTVLRTGELEELMRTVREAEPVPPPEPKLEPVAAGPAGFSRRARVLLLVGVLGAFGLGLVVGIGLMWYALVG
jgi:predicted component of type VI protein secretion system